MRNLKIPGFDAIMLSQYDRLKKDDPLYFSKFGNIDTWTPLAFPEFPGFPAEKHNIVLIGPMGLYIWFTPRHIELTSAINERADWYALNNRKTVIVWRIYFYTIISHFGGDRAIYITDKQVDTYYRMRNVESEKAFCLLGDTLIFKYGPNTKPIFDFNNGKYPRYYIDDFADLKNR